MSPRGVLLWALVLLGAVAGLLLLVPGRVEPPAEVPEPSVSKDPRPERQLSSPSRTATADQPSRTPAAGEQDPPAGGKKPDGAARDFATVVIRWDGLEFELPDETVRVLGEEKIQAILANLFDSTQEAWEPPEDVRTLLSSIVSTPDGIELMLRVIEGSDDGTLVAQFLGVKMRRTIWKPAEEHPFDVRYVLDRLSKIIEESDFSYAICGASYALLGASLANEGFPFTLESGWDRAKRIEFSRQLLREHRILEAFDAAISRARTWTEDPLGYDEDHRFYLSPPEVVRGLLGDAAQLGTPESIALVFEYSRDPEPRLRESALEAIRGISTNIDPDLVAARLPTAQDWKEIRSLAHALGRLGDSRGDEAALDWIRSTPVDARTFSGHWALSGLLIHHRRPEGVDHLISLFEAERADPRALNSEMKALTGTDLGYEFSGNPERDRHVIPLWRKWWTENRDRFPFQRHD